MLGVLAMMSCRGSESPRPRALTATGNIEGTVRLLGGELPKATRLQNTTDPEVCSLGHTLEDLVVSTENRGVRYAIAAVRDVPSEATPPFEPGRLVLNNTECRFSPHAAVMVVGSTLEAVNSDPILHTTHLYGPAELNISLPVKGVRSERRLERTGLYTVRCDVHGWMQAIIRVDPHPFHAVTDESGAFRIDGVPEGRYTIEVWHEKLGSREREVEVEEGTTATVVIEYSMDP